MGTSFIFCFLSRSHCVGQLIEKWRTDFLQMMAHHAVTISLVSFSYFQHFHISGTAVLITLDVADIFLPLAKV
jgi:acyl-CoA-dependent ceramide synthase